MINLIRIKEALILKGLDSSRLLNAMDNMQDIVRMGGLIDDNACAVLYHATSSLSANQILEKQMMYGKENGLFFSTSATGNISGYGDVVLEVKVPIESISIDDIFADEIHYRYPVKTGKKVPFLINRYSRI